MEKFSGEQAAIPGGTGRRTMGETPAKRQKEGPPWRAVLARISGRTFFANAGSIAIGIASGIALGAAGTASIYGMANPFWKGKGVEWIAVVVSGLAAVVTIIAIRSAFRSAKEGINAQWKMRDAEANAEEKDRLRRTKLHARIVWNEISDLLVRCKGWRKMLAEDGFTLEEIYEHVAGAQCAALEATMMNIHIFDYEDGFAIASCLTGYRNAKLSATMNRGWIKGWGGEKREAARLELDNDLNELEVDVARALQVVDRLVGATTPIEWVTNQAAERFLTTQRQMQAIEDREIAKALSIV